MSLSSYTRVLPRPVLYSTILSIFLLSLAFLVFSLSRNGGDVISYNVDHRTPSIGKAIVMAKMPYENTSWLSRLPSWKPYIYTLPSDPSSTLSLPNNKGREAMAYLTYIIDNYSILPEISAFIHASPTQWHNDADPLNYHTSTLLSRLNLSAVKRNGYVNLRCSPTPGCPTAVRPFDPFYKEKDNPVYSQFGLIYTELFNVSIAEVPGEIAGVCCSQFVVSRDRIWGRKREEYVGMRDWASRSRLDNIGVGSVFEMLWHAIFLEGSVLCPDPKECFCEVYDMCDV